jgi:hypothetical protein
MAKSLQARLLDQLADADRAIARNSELVDRQRQTVDTLTQTHQAKIANAVLAAPLRSRAEVEKAQAKIIRKLRHDGVEACGPRGY